MDIPLLPDIVIILGLSVFIVLLFHKLKLPSILGFLITGILIGPHGFGLVQLSHEVELLAEIGIIFLLFVIGIEFSLSSLASIKKTVVWGGFMQVGGTIGVTALGAHWFGLPLNEAIFLGFLFSLSSTAIVLKLLQERGEIASPHGRIAIGILIFQDIIVVPMMLAVPIMAGETEDVWGTVLWMVVKVAGLVTFVILLARYVVPTVLKLVVKTKSRELFILTVVVMCFATAWLTNSVGLSLALGAFFAGLIISESDYSHQATANILPFREIFVSFFFVSIGMLLDLGFFFDHIILIHTLALGVVLMKMAVVAIAVLVLGYPVRTMLIAMLTLFQVGEFAFLLSATGMQYNMLSENVYQYFLAVSIVTMGATPFLMMFSGKIADFLIKAPLPKPVRQRLNVLAKRKMKEAVTTEELRDHLVIIGYGINGQNVAKAARQAKIPHVIIELDPHMIDLAKENSEQVLFGDATDPEILHHVHIERARVVVVAISDPLTTKKIVNVIRDFSDTAYVIVRTRYIREIEENLRIGADEVIPEEFETSIEIFTSVLKKYLVPADEIQDFIHSIRSHNYDMLLSANPDRRFSGTELHIPSMEIAALKVQQGDNRVVGRTIEDCALRTAYGITVLAIKRGDRYITEVSPSHDIQQDDVLYIFGSPKNIAGLNKFLKM
jgi:CPA2 family monovalent cation:H+ antiporter-2